MPTGIVWTVPPDKVLNDLTGVYVAAIRAGVLAIANRRAPEITNWMQQNAPWQDITTVARVSLLAEVFQMGLDMVEIYMSHGAYYGIFLETSNAGKYQILAPTLDVWSAIVWADIKAMLR